MRLFRERNKTVGEIDKEDEISTRTCLRWRQHTGKTGLESAQRRPGKHRPERSLKLFDDTLDLLISFTRHPYRDIFLEHQIDQVSLDTHTRTLERNLKTRRDAHAIRSDF